MVDKKVLRKAIWMVRDTISAAATQAHRASEMFEGNEEMVLLHDLGIELTNFATTSPALKRLLDLSHTAEGN